MTIVAALRNENTKVYNLKVGKLHANNFCSKDSRYRYGFNGMEKDDEAKGKGNSYDFGARIYDARVGRFLSLDPLRKEYPMWSPYLFSANNPIKFIDVNGEGPGDGPFSGRAYMSGKKVQVLRITTEQRVAMQTYGAIIDVVIPGTTLRTVLIEGYNLFTEPSISVVASLGVEIGLYAADKITDHASKDIIVGDNRKGFATANKVIKGVGFGLNILSVVGEALDNSPSRQETLEKMTFDLAGKMYGDVNIVNEGLFKFDDGITQSPEIAERLMNRLYNSLSTLLPESQYDLTSPNDINAAYDVIGKNSSKIAKDINKNISIDRDNDEN